MGFTTRIRSNRASALLSLMLAATGLTALAGCSFFKDAPGKDAACPSVGIVPELARLSRFQGTDSNFNTLTYRASLDGVKGNCTFTDTSVTVNASVTLLAERGPLGVNGVQNFDYFVAVTDDAGNVLSKSNFPAPLTFAPGQARAGSSEGPQVMIPIPNPGKAVLYHVLIGFQLSAEERAYNFSHKVGG
jgi:hypothetical protein